MTYYAHYHRTLISFRALNDIQVVASLERAGQAIKLLNTHRVLSRKKKKTNIELKGLLSLLASKKRNL